MKHPAALVAIPALAALLIQGCSTTAPQPEPAKPAASAEPAKPALSAEAQAALAQAEADVKQAKAAFALWTTAEDALKAAQEAAQAGDSATVIKKAKTVSDHVKMGLAQTAYPSTEPK